MTSDESAGTQVAVLVVAPASDRVAFRRMFERSRWTLLEAETVAEAAAALHRAVSLILICDAQLPDGTWADLVDLTRDLPLPPPVIVTARQADDDFWMRVLNRGGYNVLGRPFSEKEVFEMVSVAWRHRKDRVSTELRAAG